MPVKLPWPGSSINKTADDVGPAPQDMQVMGRRLIDHGGGAAPQGSFFLALKEYSIARHFYNEEGQGWAYFYPTAWSLAAGSNGTVVPGSMIPDNLAWQTPPGNDGIFMVERPKTGQIWGIWMARQPAINCLDFINHPGPSFQNLWAGVLWNNPTHCASGAGYTDYIYKTNQMKTFERGNGMAQRALLTTIEELLEGVIRHALQLTLTNTWFSEGPASQGKVGVDFLYPALRCEWDRARSQPTREGHPFPSDKSKLTLHGLRIRFRLTGKEQEEWLDRNVGKTSTPFRNFCRIVLRAMCDYGFVTTDTGHYGMLSQFDGICGSGMVDGKIVPSAKLYKDHFGIDASNATKFTEQTLIFKGFMLEFRDRVQVVNPIQ